MTAERASHIQSNIEFAFSENRALLKLIAEAQKTDGTVNFIAQKAAAILQATRECFDYCAVDIRDDLIPAQSGSGLNTVRLRSFAIDFSWRYGQRHQQLRREVCLHISRYGALVTRVR